MEKKKILFCTNCQGHAISRILSKFSDEFNSKYECLIIENWVLLNKMIDNNDYKEKISSADIFVYQPLKKEHGELSTETENGLLTYLKPTVKVISFPYIYNNGFWPFFKAVNKEDEFHPGLSQRNIINSESLNEIFFDNLKCKEHQECINKANIGKINIKCIQNKYILGKLNFNYKNRFINSLNILKDNENKYNTTIKISKYIEDNYKMYKLFLSKDHPTTRILLYCANDILKLLNLPLLDIDKLGNELDENYSGLPDSEFKRKQNNWPITKQCQTELELCYNDDDGDNNNDATNFFYKLLTIIFSGIG